MTERASKAVDSFITMVRMIPSYLTAANDTATIWLLLDRRPQPPPYFVAIGRRTSR